MKGIKLPTVGRLIRAYELLQFHKGDIPVKSLILWSRWSRIDARLAELLVNFFAQKFARINPFEIWTENNALPQPETLAVILEFSELRLQDKNLLAAFSAWRETAIFNLKPAPLQLFYIPPGAPKPEKMRMEIKQSLKPFRKWGFAGMEGIALGSKTPHSQKRNRTLLDKSARLLILEKLARSKDPFKVEDYLRACDFHISRRTAERDLKNHPTLRGRGSTRGRTYWPC